VYATITRVATGEQPPRNASIVAEEMTGWFSDLPGFEGMLMLSREGETLGITFWSSREALEGSTGELRAGFVERMAGVVGVEIVDRHDYALAFARLSDTVNTQG
jgi:hypothetical protein